MITKIQVSKIDSKVLWISPKKLFCIGTIDPEISK